MMPASSINNPHDRFFRHALTDRRVAIDFFRQHLPIRIQDHIDFDSLYMRQESYVDKELKMSIADVVYSADIAGKSGYLYVLVEAQSSESHQMPLRILRYCLNIMQYHLDQYKTDNLPIVYPMVFYNGEKQYSKKTDFFLLFGKHEKLMREILLKPFHLIDVHRLDDIELKQHLWSGTLAFICKHVRARNIQYWLEMWLESFIEIAEAEGDDFLVSVLKYILNQGEAKAEEIVAFVKKKLPTSIGERAMTIAEQLEARGYNRGMQQGMQQGMQEGMQQGMEEGSLNAKRAIALKLLKNGVNYSIIYESTGLNIDDIQPLLTEMEK